jgi:hypothetical protein
LLCLSIAIDVVRLVPIDAMKERAESSEDEALNRTAAATKE